MLLIYDYENCIVNTRILFAFLRTLKYEEDYPALLGLLDYQKGGSTVSGISLSNLTPREEGQGLIEYALILVLVAIVVIAILLLLGPVVGNVFSNITVNLQRAGVVDPGTPTFSVTSVSAGAVSAGGGTSSANWSANCSVGGCAVTVTCTFLNGGGNSIGSTTTSNTPCWVTDSSGVTVEVQVVNATASGYTWDGSAPSYP